MYGHPEKRQCATTKVSALLLVLASLPMLADDKPGIPIVEPEEDEGGCEECVYSEYDGSVSCEPDPIGAGWMDCEGGWFSQCDATGDCVRTPDCGQRCAIA
ncbi:MAG TPA: hypothetical protein VNI54_06985 [Thermoanaerobaculia bacterium]|nr:hypothetical protein [Thermoanaerobaculia bacterium]